MRTWRTAWTEDFQLLFAIELGLVRILQYLVSIREGIESSGKQSTACLRKAKYSSWRSALTKDFRLLFAIELGLVRILQDLVSIREGIES